MYGLMHRDVGERVGRVFGGEGPVCHLANAVGQCAEAIGEVKLRREPWRVRWAAGRSAAQDG